MAKKRPTVPEQNLNMLALGHAARINRASESEEEANRLPGNDGATR